MPEAKPMSLGQKMIAIMDEMQAVKKEGFNVNQKYPFVQEADVVNAVRPLLIKHKVLVHQTVFIGPDGMPAVSKSPDGKITTIIYEMQLIDAETGETWPESLIVQDGWDQGDKGPNKTLTGANKWFHMRTWQIGAGTKEESEGDEKTDKLADVESAKAGPVRVTRGSQPGVERGGKASVATTAQIKEIVKQVQRLGLDADGFATIIRATTGIEPDGKTGKELLSSLSAEQAKATIEALTTMVPDLDEEPDEADEQDPLPLV